MPPHILFYATKLTKRLQYVADWVFTEHLGLDLVFTSNLQTYVDYAFFKINYSDKPLNPSELHIVPHALLFEEGIKSRFTSLKELEHDPFAFIFFCISRYEEYNLDPSVVDAYGRFSAAKSIAKKDNLLQQPIVNLQILNIKKQLKRFYPDINFKEQSYRYEPTFDIDMPWLYRNKGFGRQFLGFLRDFLKFQLKKINERQKILRGVNPDPDFTFDTIEYLHEKYDLKPIFFWLLGDYGKYDKNTHWKNIDLQQIIKKIAGFYPIGIHPSYASNVLSEKIKTEKKRLEIITGQQITNSRQHFLKLSFPTTYRRLIEAGITDDYSMGYSDDIGFRAGTATPFKWYDLEREEVTDLTIHPFQVMDVTLKQYLNLAPHEVLVHVKPLIEATKAVDGVFTTLWHNPSVSNYGEWENWREVYENILDMAVCS
jgi:hypothetical protein